MNRKRVKIINDGISIGRIHKIDSKPVIDKKKVSNVNCEIEKLKKAIQYIKKKDHNICNEKAKEIIQAQNMLIYDDFYIARINDYIIKERVCAEFACIEVGKELAKKFESSEDINFRSKAEDIIQISERLTNEMLGFDNSIRVPEDSVIAAESFSVESIAMMDKTKVRGLIAMKGAKLSHVAILSSEYGLPYITGIGMDELAEGQIVIINSEESEIILSPDDECIKVIENRIENNRVKKQFDFESANVKFYANISGLDSLNFVRNSKAEGIGLFRTEFMFMNRNEAPSEEEQYKIYSKILRMMQNKEVVIRTIDLGQDKEIPYLNVPGVSNSAFGYRGIRFSLMNQELFHIQLRALLRAAVFGNLGVLFPMITSYKEVIKIKEHIAICEKELLERGYEYIIPKIGIMIETPAAALISDGLAKYVDFFSIGTNDLLQYTYAIDRQLDGLEEYYDPKNEAVIKLITMVINNAHKNNIPVSICGQIILQKDIMALLIDIGIDIISLPVNYFLDT